MHDSQAHLTTLAGRSLRALCVTGLLVGAMSLAACGGGGDGGDTPDGPPTPFTPDVKPDVKPDVTPDVKPDVDPDVPPVAKFTVAGSVTGLLGHGLVLQNNGADDLSVSADGSFRFAHAVGNGGKFAVTVKSQPESPTQTCTVNEGSGVVQDANVDQVRVTCHVNAYRVTGTVTGLTGGGLVLENNGSDRLDIDGDGKFTFPKSIASGASYQVSVIRPGIPAQRCNVAQSSGRVEGSDIQNVQVQCGARIPQMAFIPMSGRLLRYQVDPATGVLTSNGEVTLRSNAPKALAIDPLGRFGYGLTNGTGEILIYAVDRLTGTIKGPATSFSGLPYSSVALHPRGGLMYTANESTGSITAYRIDASNGALTRADTTTTDAPRDMAIDSLGEHLYVLSANGSKISTFAIDPDSGALTLKNEANIDGASGTRLLLAPDGNRAYLVSPDHGVVTVDINGGKLTRVAEYLETGLREFTLHPNGRFAYLTNLGTSVVKSFAIGEDGKLTEVGQALQTGTDPASASIDPSGKFFYVSNSQGATVTLYGIDPITGALSLSGGYPTNTEVQPGRVAFSWH